MSETPERGDVVWIPCSPLAGHEQAGRRPALVLSPSAYNGKVGLALLCPIASRVKGFPFEVAIPPGLPIEGVVLADQVRSLDWRSKRVEKSCTLPAATVAEVLAKLSTLLPGIPRSS